MGLSLSAEDETALPDLQGLLADVPLRGTPPAENPKIQSIMAQGKELGHIYPRKVWADDHRHR